MRVSPQIGEAARVRYCRRKARVPSATGRGRRSVARHVAPRLQSLRRREWRFLPLTFLRNIAPFHTSVLKLRFQQQRQVPFPLLDRGTHLIEISMPIVDTGHGAHHAIGPIDERAEAVVKQFFDDVRRHAKPRLARRSCAAQIMQLIRARPRTARARAHRTPVLLSPTR